MKILFFPEEKILRSCEVPHCVSSRRWPGVNFSVLKKMLANYILFFSIWFLRCQWHNFNIIIVLHQPFSVSQWTFSWSGKMLYFFPFSKFLFPLLLLYSWIHSLSTALSNQLKVLKYCGILPGDRSMNWIHFVRLNITQNWITRS